MSTSKLRSNKIPDAVREHYRTLDNKDGPLVSDTRKLKHTIERLYPNAWKTIEACLAVAAAGLLADNDRCVALILVGLPGVGKTRPLSFIMPDAQNPELYKRFYRSDKFTARAFVSHRADRNKEQLGEIDLLPKIKGKTLITPELAPLFRGKREELVETFAVLARVLDGDGLQTDSGAQGRRGYAGKYVFRWLGATTPLDAAAVEVMGQLGPRLFFFEVTRAENDDDDFEEILFGEGRAGAHAEAMAATQHYLERLYRHFPEPVDTSRIGFPSDLRKPLMDCARVLVRLRAPIRTDDGDADAQVELPERVAEGLKYLALGRALVWGRSNVIGNDLRFALHIALSSGVPGRQQVMSALIRAGGEATMSELIAAMQRSRSFVHRYAEELKAVRLVNIREGGGKGNETVLSVDDQYQSLLLRRRNAAANLEAAA